jgi:hypothetical protein
MLDERSLLQMVQQTRRWVSKLDLQPVMLLPSPI